MASLFRIYSTKIRLRIGSVIDYLRFKNSIRTYKNLLKNLPAPDQGSLLIVSGRGMNIHWAQIWILLSLPLRLRGYKILALTSRKQRLLNLYFRLLNVELVYLDAETETRPLDLGRITSFEDYRHLKYKDAPLGEIALSTYSRHFGTGVIDLTNPATTAYVQEWAQRIASCMDFAERVFIRHQVKMLFFTEVFMEEYGAFYYAALRQNLNVIRFAGTVRDNAFIVQHLSKTNDRIHHSSLDPTSWAKIKNRTDDAVMEQQLTQNFEDRYGHKWHRSKRNHPNTKILSGAEARQQLNIDPKRKVAIVYSHILYDTLFFFGTDLFDSYATWLVETVRAAIANPHVDWLIKVHPSNLWRGELDTLLKGKYEEERLLQKEFGQLPPHVRIVGADTKISPYSWFQLADYGITVRGTSGLEMAALGKTVITAGTGRYEGNGFTIDPKNAAEYLNILKNLHELPAPSPDTVRLAKRYAHAIFVLKPYTLESLTPCLRWGKKVVTSSDDLIYSPRPLTEGALLPDVTSFGAWALKSEDRDLLSEP